MASNYSPLTTHVLNTATGKPANDMQIVLHRMKSDSSWEILKQGYGTRIRSFALNFNLKKKFTNRKTNEDGRLLGLIAKEEFSAGMYKMFFDTSSYFKEMNTNTFYPHVEVWVLMLFFYGVTQKFHSFIPGNIQYCEYQ